MTSTKTLWDLQTRTKLSLVECHRALAQGKGNIDDALRYLRAQGLLQGLSFDSLKSEVRKLAADWAKQFLEDTKESGELSEYDAKGELATIQENYYHCYVAGMPSSHHHVLKSELAVLPSDQQDALEEIAYSAYADWVAQNLAHYL